MSLETLIEAAYFLEQKADTKKTVDINSKAADSQNSTSNTDDNIGFSSCTKTNESSQLIEKKDVNHSSRQSSTSVGVAEAAGLLNNFSNRSNHVPGSYQVKSVISTFSGAKSLPVTAGNISADSLDDSKASSASNMDPLFARASAAVKSPAFFSQKEGVLIHSPRNIPSAGLTLPPHGVAIDPHAFSSNGALNLQLKQSYFPVNTGLASSGHVTILNNQTKLPSTSSSDRSTVSIMPSLKPVVDSKTYAALQIKTIKRNITLTHNQLEKNRRAHLKECFEELKKAIPRLGMRRSSNLTILKAALKQIQTLKRKSANHQQILARLSKELIDKRSKEAILKKELLKIADSDKIEAVVAELLRSGMKQSTPTTCLYDTSQMSTSTASEAEDEEYRGYGEVLFQPVSSSQHVAVEEKSRSVQSHLFEPKKVALVSPARYSPSYEHLGDLQIVETDSDVPHHLASVRSSQAPVLSRPQQQSYQQVSKSHEPNMYNPSKAAFVSKRQPIKSQPARRSATPTPSSDFVQFFPRFSVGSGGSPPLISPNFDFSCASTMNEKALLSRVSATRPSTENQSPATTSGEIATSQSKLNLSSTFVKTEKPSEVNGRGLSKESELAHHPVERISTTSDTVLVTSYPGYEVKVKYLTPATTSIATSFTKSSQARIPMKKRTLNVESFTQSSPPSADTRTSASGPSDHKMTSLYVAASATLLDSSSSGKTTSTSDHESDLETNFLDRKKGKFHWRKTLLNEQVASGENRNKMKKKTYQVHQYEMSDSKTPVPLRNQVDGKRKAATFNLWDRKHHAITPTSSRNWRGKQQLITSKPKTNTSSSSSQAPVEAALVRPLNNSNVTTVSYSLLQKSSKPAVPASLLTTTARPLSTLESANKRPSTGISQDESKTPIGIPLIPGQKLQSVGPVPFQIPGNPISYHIVPSPASVPTSFVRSTSSGDVLLSSMQTPSSHPAAVTSVSPSDLAKSAKDALNLLQPAAQPNSLQLPCILPVNYVMYPPSIPNNGMHLATLPQPTLPHPTKVVTPSDVTAATVDMSQRTRSPLKRNLSPAPPLKPPSRNQSNESASSATLSADSVDFESHKSVPPLKKPRQSEQAVTPQTVILPQHATRLAQPQFVFPGSSGGFMVAAPTSNGFSLPFNVLGYPIQAYAGAGPQGYLQAVPMAFPSGINSLWPVNQTVLPSVEGGSTVVTIPTNVTSRTNHMTSPVARSNKVD